MQCFKQQATFYARRKGLEASGRQKDRLWGSRTLRLKEASTYEMKKSISKHLSTSSPCVYFLFGNAVLARVFRR